MKKILIYMLLAVLALSGCGQKPAAEKTTLQITVEGQTEEVPAAQYIGNGFAIYIPEEGWQLDEQESDDGVQETVWESTVNDDVELFVLRYPVYPDATVNETKAHFARECGYVFEDLMGGDLGDPLTGMDEDGDFLGFMAAEGVKGVTYVVAWEYPKETAEGFGVCLPQIANTFTVTK